MNSMEMPIGRGLLQWAEPDEHVRLDVCTEDDGRVHGSKFEPQRVIVAPGGFAPVADLDSVLVRRRP